VKPYYDDGQITLYCGDALEVLATLPAASADVLLTDPPYCSGGSLEAQKNTAAQGLRSATVRAAGFRWFAADNMTTGGLVALLRSALLEARRLLRPDRSAFVFTDWRMAPLLAPALEASGLRYRNLLVWDKGSPGLGNGFKPTHELVLEFTNGATRYRALDGENVLRYPRVHPPQREHMAEKPVPLLCAILRVVAPARGVVCDPFAGSGTTLRAAKNLGLRAIGVELDERNCEATVRRLAQQALPLEVA
jgi:site-specific DNA-methyltransferase (adenine-specific)